MCDLLITRMSTVLSKHFYSMLFYPNWWICVMVFNGNAKKTKKNDPLYLPLQDPTDVYLVGKRLDYRCITEHHLVGNAVIECMEDQTWSQRPGTCEGMCQSSVNISFTNIIKGFLTSTISLLYHSYLRHSNKSKLEKFSGIKHTHSQVNPSRYCPVKLCKKYTPHPILVNLRLRSEHDSYNSSH